MNKSFIKVLGLLLVVGLLFAGLPTGQAQAQTGTTVQVGVLDPSWTAPGGGGVWSQYWGPNDDDVPVSPGVTATYDGREAGIIKAGQALGAYWDQGLFAFKTDITIEALMTSLNFDVNSAAGVNPVWMTIEIDTGTPGYRDDNTTYQYVPTSNPVGWHNVDATIGLWQKWNNGEGDTSGNPLLSSAELVTNNPGLHVIRVYLRLGMGDSYYNDGTGTVGWVDKVVIGTVTYDFVVIPTTACTTDCYVDAAAGDDTFPGTLSFPFKTIQKGINTVSVGGTVHVAAGTYSEQVNINKRVSIIGSGKDGSNATIITSNALGTVLLGATGTAESPILLKDLQITGAWGVRTAITPIDYFTMDNVWLNANPVKSGEGFRLVIGHQMTHLTIKNSIIEGYIDGVIIEKTPGTGSAGTKLQYVTVTDTIFRNNYRKGLYLETLSDAIFTNVQLLNNGYVNPGTNLAEYNSAGFDINLKDGAYSNLQFINMTATSNGLKAKDGAALMIKARDDGATYGVYPATLDSVLISGGSFTGNERGIRFGEPGKTNSGPTNVVILGAALYGNEKTYESTDGSAYGDVVNYSLANVDAIKNWWGSPLGPQAPIFGDVDVIQWCADAACTKFAPNAEGVIELSGTYNVAGGINIYVPHIKYFLKTGTVIQNSSPCFNVHASYVTIEAETIGGAACVPTDGANGINVDANLVNIIVKGLEITGLTPVTLADQVTGSGIAFAGPVADVQVIDNWFHDLDASGVTFGGAVTGTHDIQGNLFQNLAAAAIVSPTTALNAEFNSWGLYAGATLTNVDSDPWTHVDLSVASSDTQYVGKEVLGQTFTITVSGNLQNVVGASFALTYDTAKLTLVSATETALFGPVPLKTSVLDTATAGVIKYDGYKYPGVTGTNQVFYTATFTAAAVGDALFGFDLLTDVYAMTPLYGPSSNIYPTALTGTTVTILQLPTVTSTFGDSYYLAGEQRQFSVVLTNPVGGANYAHVYLDYKLTGADMDHISLLEYSVDNGTTWVALGTGPGTTYGEDGLGNIVGYFGKVDGAGFSLPAGATLPTLFRVTFVERDQEDPAVDFPTSYGVEMKLMDADALFTTAPLDEFTATMNVYDKPSVIVAPDPYFIVGEPGEFTVTINNPTTGRYYNDTAVFDVVIANHAVADISALSCTMSGYTWDLLGSLTFVDPNVVARIVGAEGGFTIPPTGVDAVITCSVTFATPGTYVTSGNMVDVISTTPLVERVVSDNVAGTATVYVAPTVSAEFPTGPYAAGVPVTVPVTITNPGSIPGPFVLVLDLPAGTTIVYNGVTYTCVDDPATTVVDVVCPPIPVTLPMTDSDLVITFPGSFTGDVGMSLYDTTWDPDRLLAELTPKQAVIVNSGFVLTGTFSMQGRASRAGIPVTLTWGGTLATYGPSASTSEVISNNFTLTLDYGGDYTLTTLQPRYLNVTTALGKTITALAADRAMLPLELKGGNAVWRDVLTGAPDNVIDTSDASLVGTQYGSGGTSDGYLNNGDCNFDGKVNIQDLALIGGNYDLQSYDPLATTTLAYQTWMP